MRVIQEITQEQSAVRPRMYTTTFYSGKRHKAVYLLVITPQGGTKKYTLTFSYDSPRCQIGFVPLFGAGPRRYIRSRLLRLAVTAFWHALTASWRQKGKRKHVLPRAIRTTELPSNPSPLSTRDDAQLTFRNNQIQILQTSSTLGNTQP